MHFNDLVVVGRLLYILFFLTNNCVRSVRLGAVYYGMYASISSPVRHSDSLHTVIITVDLLGAAASFIVAPPPPPPPLLLLPAPQMMLTAQATLLKKLTTEQQNNVTLLSLSKMAFLQKLNT